jgi:hypothetical protein
LDEQFCVLARMSIRSLNEILIRIGSEDVITEKVIEVAFKEWASFKKRPDFRKYMLEWFIGKPLSELPPAPVGAKQSDPASPSPEAEGPQEFGGDYAAQQKSDERDEAVVEGRQSDSFSSQTDALPAGQDIDSPVPKEGERDSSTLS